jgi:hypothetical protein
MTRHRLCLYILNARNPIKTQVLFIGSTTDVKIIQFIHTYIYIHKLYLNTGKKHQYIKTIAIYKFVSIKINAMNVYIFQKLKIGAKLRQS